MLIDVGINIIVALVVVYLVVYTGVVLVAIGILAMMLFFKTLDKLHEFIDHLNKKYFGGRFFDNYL